METLKSILTDLEDKAITKHQAYDLILVLFDVSNSIDNETLVEDCGEYSHNQCDCVGKYCQYGK